MSAETRHVVSFPRFPKPYPLVTLWDERGRPDEQALRARLTGDGYQVVGWSSGPAQGYPPHAHVYPELLYVIRGSLAVILPVERRLLELEPGDRIEIPIGLVHGTMAGSEGASYLLATR
jgi:quercetin dioxygenase-like cupin family protein